MNGVCECMCANPQNNTINTGRMLRIFVLFNFIDNIFVVVVISDGDSPHTKL